MTVQARPLGRLVDCSLRDAWAHEAHDFTAWLADNLDFLSEAIGVPLEFEAREQPVESFSADLLARNAEDGSRVLIENQLERTDHTHLGQILTYMAGLEVDIVVWIAGEFREPHLSALRWLNEKTGTDVAFFGVRLRAVRIGDSPIAPVFEVLAKPNDWERQLKETAPKKGGSSEEGRTNGEFWQAYLSAHPEDARLGIKASRLRNNWIRPGPDVMVSIWASVSACGIFVRPGWGQDGTRLSERLEPVREALERRLGAPLAPDPSFRVFQQRGATGNADPDDVPRTIEWLHEMAHRYVAALRELVLVEGEG